MIPARIGSERLKFKNLSLLNGKPLIYYAINSSLKSRVFDKIYLNSDNNIFEKISNRYKCNFYLRKKTLGGSNIKSDAVVYDFFKNNDCDVLVWVNPIAPLIKITEIKNTLKYFLDHKYNSLITTHKKYAHSLLGLKPINFKFNEEFSKTQDLEPITIMNYSLMPWDHIPFLNEIILLLFPLVKILKLFLKKCLDHALYTQKNKNLNNVLFLHFHTLGREKNILVNY